MHVSEGRHPTIRVSGLLIPLTRKPVLSREDTFGIMEALLTKESKELFLKIKKLIFRMIILANRLNNPLKSGRALEGMVFFNKELSVSLFGLYRKRFARQKS